MLRNKIVYFKNIYKFTIDYFLIIVIYFLLPIKNAFIKIKSTIFPPKYTRYGKNVKKQNCSFLKNLQLWC